MSNWYNHSNDRYKNIFSQFISNYVIQINDRSFVSIVGGSFYQLSFRKNAKTWRTYEGANKALEFLKQCFPVFVDGYCKDAKVVKV
jgi:hypothetical protein